MKFKQKGFYGVIIISICMFFITPVNALEYSITDFTDFNDMNEYDINHVLVCGANSFYGDDAVALFNTDDGSSNVLITNFANIQAVGYDGDKIYWSSGNTLYMYDGDFLLNGSYHTEGIDADYTQIASYTETISDIFVDSTGNIYIAECRIVSNPPNPQGYVHKIVPPTYALSQIYHRTSGSYLEEIEIFSNSTNMMLYESSSFTGTSSPHLVTILDDSYTNIESFQVNNLGYYGRSVYTTSNDDIYFCVQNVLYRLDFNNSYSESVISSLASAPRGMVITNEGIIYIAFVDGKIRNYLTVDEVGGYSSFLSSTGLAPSTLFYDISNIESMYDTYFNDSNIEISYNIKTELLSNDNEYLFNNYMRFRIDLLQGIIPINTEYIETSEFKRSLGYLNIYTLDSEHRYNKDGTITYTPSPNWDSGVYNVKLYEITNDTLSQLDVDTYTVLTTESNVSITTTQYTPTGDVSEITNKLMSSNLFYAGIIIMTFTAIGAVYGGVGAAIGGFVGTAISYGVDLIPEWVVLAIVILLIVVGAILMSKGGE